MKQSKYKIRITNQVAEFVRGMHPHLKSKIKASLKIIVLNPNEGKALKDELAGLRSFRVSRFRIIYRVQRNVVEIVTIGPRERIYEETFSILKKKKRTSTKPNFSNIDTTSRGLRTGYFPIAKRL